MATTFGRIIRPLCVLLASVVATAATAEPKLFESSRLTPPGEYTSGIEGPAVDRDGNLFVPNLGRSGTIGKVAPGAAHSEKFIDLPQGSISASIRFDQGGTMFVADYKRHNIFAIGKGSLKPQVWFHSDLMHQPNDMTIARDGTIYASDPYWKAHSGQIWRIAKDADGVVHGQVMTAPRAMGTTNGIDLSPDEHTLYVGDSNTGQLWSYDIDGGELKNARLIRTFDPDSIDGIRTDAAGKLLIARISKGTIAVMTPDGNVQREIPLQGKEPTNLALGGADGRTVFVAQRQGGFVEWFRTDREGREYCLQKGGC